MSDYSYYWAELYNDIGNEYGVSALMGNLQAESGIISYRLQGDFTYDYNKSVEYTEKVDNGTISRSEFISDSKGYGLAQWTYITRKEALYDLHIETGLSIGSPQLGVTYLLRELKNNFPSVYSALKSATDIRSASDIVLTQFENPKVQTEEVKRLRAKYGNNIFNTYATGELPPIPVPPEPIEPTERNNIMIYGGVADLMRRKIIP